MGVAAANHVSICKFSDKDSQRYMPVWTAIQTLCVQSKEVTASSI